MKKLLVVMLSLVVQVAHPLAQSPSKRLLTLDDLHTLREIGDPQISPEGNWMAYTVSTGDVKADKRNSDLWMTNWEGTRTVQLTFSKTSEHSPRWSPDGQWLAFLSSREVEEETDQIWLMNRAGGEAEKITDLKGGVLDFVWSPDGKRLALIAKDPDPEATPSKDKSEKKTAKPIVIDRYQFKKDEEGYLTKLRQHLYVLDLAARKAELLTPGDFDEALPAWSPDNSTIAFVSKRGPEPDRLDNYDLYLIDAKIGATPRQLTTFAGPDCHPDWSSRPAWSPDGKTLAYLQGGEQKLIYYAGYQLAVISATGGAPRLLLPNADRNMTQPQWSAEGGSIYFLLEEDRTTLFAKVAAHGGKLERLYSARCEIFAFDAHANGKIALLASHAQEPYNVFALENSTLRALSHHNEAWLAKLKLGTTEEISFQSKDGTSINGFIVKPPDYQPGKKYPALLRIHGGPVSQFVNEFMFDWQYFAARGYLVIAANPRGSSGRGEKFSTAIYADWGNKDAQDVLAAVDYAVAHGLADSARLGVGGWSYGGILTNYVIAQDQRFKAAVSGSSISNILAGYGTDQYIREYEFELGTPWTSRDTWLKLSFPFLQADRITTPTLFLCGKEDFNVPLLNSEQMYQALKSLGRDTQLIIYPDQYHGITKPSYARDRLERYLAWYDKYLMPKSASTATK
ncbi:S9 family peptidase [candidate division KSB1 bacterium]|nr:S9 family peptidase [candidate division KSB1 bacterium]